MRLEGMIKKSNRTIDLRPMIEGRGIQAGTLAERPDFSAAGYFYMATDTSVIYYHNGESWVEVSLPFGGKAADSDRVDGLHAAAFATAAHNHAGVYLPVAGKAADSNLLDGLDSTAYAILTQYPAVICTGAAQSVSNAVAKYIVFNATVVDTNDMWVATATDRVTCKVAGTYLIIGTVRFSSNATGMRSVALVVNNEGAGRGNTSASPVNGGVTILNVACLTSLAIGDIVQLQAFQNSGVALTVDAIAPYSPNLSVVRVR